MSNQTEPTTLEAVTLAKLRAWYSQTLELPADLVRAISRVEDSERFAGRGEAHRRAHEDAQRRLDELVEQYNPFRGAEVIFPDRKPPRVLVRFSGRVPADIEKTLLANGFRFREGRGDYSAPLTPQNVTLATNLCKEYKRRGKL